ncbi:MAG: sugar phosphate isomerase/epimerase [Planctomycetia bacterium]|nr:sugar phosphate isomerase/epimerase [Planctomycetia bacterium]
MKFGMNMLLWTTDVNESHYGILDSLKKIGYDGVELPIFDMNVDHFAKLGQKLTDTGLQRTAVTVSTDAANPISTDPAIRQAGLDNLKKAIDCCHAAGVTHLCGPIHSALGSFTGQGPTVDERTWAKEVLTKAGDCAKQANVTLVVESLNRFECYFLNSVPDAAKFCREVGHSHVKTMYDTFHANIEEKCITTALKTSIDQIAHVHISENDRSTPGEGGVNWDETWKALKEVNYDGWLVVEAFGLALPALAAATKIWRRMFTDELTLATNALKFMKTRSGN